MNKLALVALIVCAACSKKKAEDKQPAAGTGSAGAGSATAKLAGGGAKALSEGSMCPIAKPPGVAARFAVGAMPDYAVPDMRADHGNLCHDDFTANDVVKVENGKPTIVTEGTFVGGCKASPGPRTFDAVQPAKLAISVEAMQTNEGKLGIGEPVWLDSKTPDKHAGVTVYVVDRCDEKLETGVTPEDVTWTLGDNCAAVVKVAPYPGIATPEGTTTPNPKAREMQFTPVAPGSCTVEAAWLGVRGNVAVTVK